MFDFRKQKNLNHEVGLLLIQILVQNDVFLNLKRSSYCSYLVSGFFHVHMAKWIWFFPRWCCGFVRINEDLLNGSVCCEWYYDEESTPIVSWNISPLVHCNNFPFLAEKYKCRCYYVSYSFALQFLNFFFRFAFLWANKPLTINQSNKIYVDFWAQTNCNPVI